jgi:hypothetical protein
MEEDDDDDDEDIKIPNFTKIRLMGAEVFHVDGRTDGHKNRHVYRLDATKSLFTIT